MYGDSLCRHANVEKVVVPRTYDIENPLCERPQSDESRRR
jgi:hypothetical protein